MSKNTPIAVLIGTLLGCGGGNQTDVQARRYDVARACWEEPVVVGSIAAGTGCNGALQVASKDGVCFLFSSTCLPAGFLAPSSNGTVCPNVDAPLCSH